MNYLAHAYLSFMHDEILLGNIISDFVKGKKKFDYPALIHKGIMLHRAIDAFTDEHIITKEAKQYLKPAVGLYAGAFVDVVYDHFLATDISTWKETSLRMFADYVYETINVNLTLLPEKFRNIFPYMKQHDWLFNYQYNWGIQKSFEGVARRAVYLNSSVEAYSIFESRYATFQQLSSVFLNDVKKFAWQSLQLTLKA